MKQDIMSMLQEYAKQSVYPFHMPGHKRNTQLCVMENPYGLDITEIEGFDNLHDARGILRDAMEEAAEWYGAGTTFFLVNGSSCGILASICACTKSGDRILIARNCHKSVYHAIYLQNLQPVYVYPQMEHGISGEILVEDIRRALEEYQDIRVVVLVSPTYEGVVSEIDEIADLVHQAGCLLIVDEAHGAHFGMAEGFPETAVRLGADFVIQSVHKTLPSFTQTALLHLGKEALDKGRMEKERLQRYLAIFQSSSPSYLFMAGIQKSLRLMRAHGKQLFSDLLRNLAYLREETENLRYLRILSLSHMEPSKVNIWIEEASGKNGHWLYLELLQQYHLQMEMESLHYVLAMTSVADTKEGFWRLAQALKEIDAGLCETCPTGSSVSAKEHKEYPWSYQLPVVYSIRDAYDRKRKKMAFFQAQGEISADYLFLYPPGIPLVVPGEVITQELVDMMQESLCQGLEIKGMFGQQNIWVTVE